MKEMLKGSEIARYFVKSGIALALIACLFLPPRTVKAQDIAEYALLAAFISLVLLATAAEIRTAEDPQLWDPKHSVQVQREKMYLRTFEGVREDGEAVRMELEGAIASNTRLNHGHLHGELEALKGSVSGANLDRPAGNMVGPTGQGVEYLLDGEVRAAWGNNLTAIRANIDESIRVLSEVDSRGFCGDGICQSTESCETCPDDCGRDACGVPTD